MSSRMLGLRFNGPWDLSLSDHPKPILTTPTDVIVQIRATGICGTDLGIVAGEYPARPGVILGHESAGEVIAIGAEVKSLRVGDRVVIDPTYYCGRCRQCRTQRTNHCEAKSTTEAGVTTDGMFGSYYRTTEYFCYKLPDDVSYETATLTEPLSCAITGTAKLSLRPDLSALVIGAGPMGLLYAWLLSLRGLNGVIIDRAPGRRDTAQEVVPSGWSVRATLDQSPYPQAEHGYFDVVVDTTSRALELVVPALARGGQYLAVGLKKALHTIDVGTLADRSLSIVGSIDSLNNSFSSALYLLQGRKIPADRIVTHTLPLDQFAEAFILLGCHLSERTVMEPGAAIKIVLVP